MTDEMFKTTLMGGFDKDDVMIKVRNMQDEASAEKARLIKQGKEKDKRIKELERVLKLKDEEKQQEIDEICQSHREEIMDLNHQHEKEMQELYKRLELKESQKDKLEMEIATKYQKYIDRYDLIGDLILEAQERADLIIKDAEERKETLLTQAQKEAQQCLDAVQSELDEKLAEGKRKYVAVQEELNEIVELINQAQRRFMSSYKAVHRIISTMPESTRELEDDLYDEQNEKLPVEETEELEEADFDTSEEEVVEDILQEDSLDDEDEEDYSQDELIKRMENDDDSADEDEDNN